MFNSNILKKHIFDIVLHKNFFLNEQIKEQKIPYILFRLVKTMNWFNKIT